MRDGYADTPKGQVHYVAEGEGEPLILLHVDGRTGSEVDRERRDSESRERRQQRELVRSAAVCRCDSRPHQAAPDRRVSVVKHRRVDMRSGRVLS